MVIGEPNIYHDLGVIHKNEGEYPQKSLMISVSTDGLFLPFAGLSGGFFI